MKKLSKTLLIPSFLLLSAAAGAQDSPLAWASRLETEYRIVPNITYRTASNWSRWMIRFS